MQENPYSAILGTMRKDSNERKSSAWVLGRVLSVSPLQIAYNGLTLSGANLLVNHQLCIHTRAVSLSDVSGNLDASTDCSLGSITALSATNGTLQAAGLFGGVLTAGDQVAMLKSEDSQLFIVLCKVVNA